MFSTSWPLSRTNTQACKYEYLKDPKSFRVHCSGRIEFFHPLDVLYKRSHQQNYDRQIAHVSLFFVKL